MCWGHIGIMENKMETTLEIHSLGFLSKVLSSGSFRSSQGFDLCG